MVFKMSAKLATFRLSHDPFVMLAGKELYFLERPRCARWSADADIFI